MEFRIRRDHLSHALRLLQQTGDSKPTMPILGTVLIDASDAGVTLSHTNLDAYTTLTIAATVTKPGRTALHLKRLAPIVSELPAIDTKFTLKNSHVTVKSGGSTFRILTLDPAEFPGRPDIPDGTTLDINEQTWQRHIRQVAYARARDESRYSVNGVCMEVSEKRLRFVATDGRRLALSTCDIESDGVADSIILPAKIVDVLNVLLRKDGERNLHVAWNKVRFAVSIQGGDESLGIQGDILCLGKVIEGNYPDYRKVLPAERGHPCVVERQLFASTLHRAALATSDKSNSVRFELGKTDLKFHAQSPDFGEAHESMQIEGDAEVKTAFNPVFVLECLNALTHDKLTLRIRDDHSPAIIEAGENSEFTYVVMPVKL